MWLIRVIIVLSILWLIAAVIGWMIRRALLKVLRGASEKTQQTQTKPQALEKQLVACHRCGLFVDRQKAIENQGHYYCSQAHLNQKE